MKNIKTKLNICRKELQRIKIMRGELTASILIKEASNKKNPLHNYFQWDDSIAGRQWRLHQARVLINYIIEPSIDDNKDKTYSYEIIDGVYQGIDEIMENANWRNQVLMQAIGYLNYWHSKYNKYKFKTLEPVSKEIKKIMQSENQIIKIPIKKKNG